MSPEEQSTLMAWAHTRCLPLRVVQRARIVTLAADGMLSQDIVRQVRVSRPTVQLWHERSLSLRVVGHNRDAPRLGPIPCIPEKKVRTIMEAILHTTPPAAPHETGQFPQRV